MMGYLNIHFLSLGDEQYAMELDSYKIMGCYLLFSI